MADSKVDEGSKRWEEVQKKAFLHWVNSQLKKGNEPGVESLEEGFSSGVSLISLLEILTGKTVTMKYTKSPKLRVHKINNCFIALKFLSEDCGVRRCPFLGKLLGLHRFRFLSHVPSPPLPILPVFGEISYFTTMGMEVVLAEAALVEGLNWSLALLIFLAAILFPDVASPMACLFASG